MAFPVRPTGPLGLWTQFDPSIRERPAMLMPRTAAGGSLTGVLAFSPLNTTVPELDHPDKEIRNWSSLIGIVTAIVGNILIALALNVQRYAHIRLHRERARLKERARLAERRKTSSQHNGLHYGGLDSNGSAADRRPRTEYFEGVEETWTRDGRRPSQGLVSSETGGDDEARTPASSYLRSTYWWLGQVLISLGEMGNFLAYGFAPASIVSPLGVVALISNCIIAPMLFNETFRQRDFWGVAIAVSGVVTVVLSANQQETKLEPHDVWRAITTLEFEVYLVVTGILIVVLMWISSTCHHRTILVDLGLVGLFGMSLLACCCLQDVRLLPSARAMTLAMPPVLIEVCRRLHCVSHERRLIYVVIYSLAGLHYASDIRSCPRSSIDSRHADSICKQGVAAVRFNGGHTYSVCHVYSMRHHW